MRWLFAIGSDARSAREERRVRDTGLGAQSVGSTREETCSAIRGTHREWVDKAKPY